jgi:hypothetical protein
VAGQGDVQPSDFSSITTLGRVETDDFVGHRRHGVHLDRRAERQPAPQLRHLVQDCDVWDRTAATGSSHSIELGVAQDVPEEPHAEGP